MVCNCFNTTCCADPEYKYDHKSDGHDDTLDKVRGRCCQESSQCGVSNDDQCTDDHSWQIFYTEETCKKFTTGCKSGSCIRNKKDHDKNRSDRLQDLFLISVTITEKGWQCNGISCHMCVAADSFCHDPPVYVSSDRKANGCPACICNTGKISKSRQAHQKPAAHVRSLCTHSCDKWTKLSSSKIEIRTVIIVLGAKITYKDHCTQIDDNGCHYTNMCCCHCFSPFHVSALKSQNMRDFAYASPCFLLLNQFYTYL